LVDVVSVAKRSEMMAGIRAKNTRPEMLVRKLLHAAGYRYRLHVSDLPGKPDLVLSRHKVVIFVHGCFWHGHEGCALFRLPRSREEFWANKIGENVARDRTQELKLLESGWRIVTLWECALKGKYRLAEAVLLGQLKAFFQSADHISDISGTRQKDLAVYVPIT
jgi:DNA mismatch endonuclease, patch repair protein